MLYGPTLSPLPCRPLYTPNRQRYIGVIKLQFFFQRREHVSEHELKSTSKLRDLKYIYYVLTDVADHGIGSHSLSLSLSFHPDTYTIIIRKCFPTDSVSHNNTIMYTYETSLHRVGLYTYYTRYMCILHLKGTALLPASLSYTDVQYIRCTGRLEIYSNRNETN